MTQTSLPSHDLHADPEHSGRAAGIKDFPLVARSLAEAAGSFLLVLAGLGVTILNTQTGVQPTLAFGLALIGAMVAFGYVSGGHFNPAVTLGSAIAGKTSWASVLPYIVAQVVGGVVAAVFIWLLLSANQQFAGSVQALFAVSANGYADNSPTQFALSSALLAEVVGTAIFVAVVLGATSRTATGALRNAGGPFAIGLVYAALLTFLLPITNGSLNPARSTAAAIFSEGWAIEQLWLFWVAPVLGAAIVGLIYRSTELFGGRKSEAGVAGAADGSVAAPADDDAAPAVTGVNAPSQTTGVTSADRYPAGHARTGDTAEDGQVDRPAGTDEARRFFDGSDDRRDEK
ncbi:aquaporin [Arthrobacter sp. Sr33]|uniref:aquaporin n=1 Tax=Arthrobacter sp. TB 23 TaxID=494419 RepID=UPI0003158917|nr:aquaporin [Arthrobacter sp. TB 23]